MKTIEITDEAYQAIAQHHGDVSAFVEKVAAEAHEVAAVQEGIAAYEADDYRPVEEFGEELKKRFGIKIPEA